MNPISAVSPRTCYRCGLDTRGSEPRCLKCAGQLKTAGQIRVLGWLLVGCGAFLLVFMGWIALALAPTLFPVGRPGNGPRFTGGPEMRLAISAMFALVFAFGAASLWAGINQIRTAKRSRQMLPVMLGLVSLIGVVATAMRWLK